MKKYSDYLQELIIVLDQDKKKALTANATPDEIADHIQRLNKAVATVKASIKELDDQIFPYYSHIEDKFDPKTQPPSSYPLDLPF